MRCMRQGFLFMLMFAKKHPRVSLFFFLGWFFAALFFIPEIVFAQTSIQGSIDITDKILLILADIASSVAQSIGTLIVLLVGVMMPIMQYNGFSTSPVIGAGWAIVRDTTNMFFVVILIFIAFGTIFGVSKFQWRQQVPRLMIFAIIINFSRMLCGLMIDFGQVVMLTFTNGIKDIAGGNIVQLFGLQSILEFDSTYIQQNLTQGSDATGIQSFDLFAASIAAVILMTIVFVTMVFLVLVLVYRIVMIWVLVTIVPLAWFFGGVKDIVSSANPYADWWKRFTCAVAIGPVVVFFLWLALAVAGSGSIAATEGFISGNAPDEVKLGGLLEIMDTARLTSFIIAIALIFAGFEAASKVCSGVPGMLGKAGGQMDKYGKTVLKKYENAGRAVGRYAYQQTAARPIEAAEQRVARPLLEGIAKNKTLAKIPGLRYAQRKAAEASENLKGRPAARSEELTKGDKPISAEAMAAYLKAGPSALSGVAKKQYFARLNKAMRDKAVLKELGPEELSKILNHEFSSPAEGTVTEKDGTVRAKTTADIIKERYGKDKELKDIFEQYPATMGQNLEESLVELEDFKKIDAKEWQREDVIKRASQAKIYDKDKKKEVSMLEYIHSGKGGGKLRDTVAKAEKALSQKDSLDDKETIKRLDGSNIDVKNVNVEELTPKIIADIMAKQNAEDIKKLATRLNGSSRTKFTPEEIERMKAQGLSQGNSEDRAKFRANLEALMTSATSKFDQTNIRQKVYDLSDDGKKFKTKTAEEDFKNIVKNNDTFAFAFDFKANDKISQMAATHAQEGVYEKFLEAYEKDAAAIEPKINKFKAAIRGSISDLTQKIVDAENQAASAGNKEDKKKFEDQAKSMQTELDRLQTRYDYFHQMIIHIDGRRGGP